MYSLELNLLRAESKKLMKELQSSECISEESISILYRIVDLMNALPKWELDLLKESFKGNRGAQFPENSPSK